MRRVAPFPGHPGLQRFRAEHPQGTWAEYKSDPTYNDLQKRLADHQGWCCAYCEMRLSLRDPVDFGVEHYVPKGSTNTSAHNFHLDDLNLLACCLGGTRHHLEPPRASDDPSYGSNHSCDKIKLGQSPDGQMIDPRTLPQRPVFHVRPDGQIVADARMCDALSVEFTLATRAITFLNLDCQRLRRARKNVYRDVSGMLMEVLEQLIAQGVNQPQEVLTQLRRSVLQPDGLGRDAEFETTRLACLNEEAPELTGLGAG